jgi:uncharacterized protein (TIGR00369 family)
MPLRCTRRALEAKFRRVNEESGGELAAATTIEELTDEKMVLRVSAGTSSLRPGGSVMGPMLMAYVDSAGWLTTVAHHGIDYDAFTTDVSMQFLRPVRAGEVLVEARPLRVGQRTVVAVDIRQSREAPIAVHAIITFAPLPTEATARDHPPDGDNHRS